MPLQLLVSSIQSYHLPLGIFVGRQFTSTWPLIYMTVHQLYLVRSVGFGNRVWPIRRRARRLFERRSFRRRTCWQWFFECLYVVNTPCVETPLHLYQTHNQCRIKTLVAGIREHYVWEISRNKCTYHDLFPNRTPHSYEGRQLQRSDVSQSVHDRYSLNGHSEIRHKCWPMAADNPIRPDPGTHPET